MSTKNFKQKAIFVSFLVLSFGLVSSSINQIVVYNRTIKSIKQKQKEMQALEEKNKALRVRREEVQSLKFLDEQSRGVLGLGDASGTARLSTGSPNLVVYTGEIPPGSSNLQKWRELFGF